MRAHSGLLLSLIFVVLACDVYVDPLDGGDTAGCGAEETPCKTIASFTSVCLAVGNYTLETVPLNITKWKRINDTSNEEVSCGSLTKNLKKLLDSVDILHTYERWDDTKEVNGSSFVLSNNTLINSVIQLGDLHTDLFGRLKIHQNLLRGSSITADFISKVNPNIEIVKNQFVGREGLIRTSFNTEMITDNEDVMSTDISVMSNSGNGSILLQREIGPMTAQSTSPQGSFSISMWKNNVNRLSVQYEHKKERSFASVSLFLNIVREVTVSLNCHQVNLDVYFSQLSLLSFEGTNIVYWTSDMLSNQIHRLVYSIGLSSTSAFSQMFLNKNDLQTVSLDFQMPRQTGGTFAIDIKENRWTEGGNTSALSIEGTNAATINVTNNNITGQYFSSSGGGIRIHYVRASDIIISHNRALTGAGISILSSTSNITIQSNELNNNVASISSGALNILGDQVRSITVTQCTMDKNFAPHASAFDIAYADLVQIHDNIILVNDSASMDDTVAVSMKQFSLQNSVYCPTQLRLELNTSGYSCAPCMGDSYILGTGQLHDGETKDTQCQPCSAHLDCSERIPKGDANYWCTELSDHKIKCYDCPDGYCKERAHPWDDNCAAGRTGKLCGECDADHRLSILSSACIHKDRCMRGFITPIILAPFVYFVIFSLLPVVKPNHLRGMKGLLAFAASPGGGDGGPTGWGICIGELDYVQRQLMMLYIPVATVIIFAIAFAGAGLYYRLQKKEEDVHFPLLDDDANEVYVEKTIKRSIYSRFGVGLVTAYLLVYGGITSICLKLLFCIEIEESDTPVLYNAGTIKCSGPWRIVLIVASATVLLPSPFIILLIREERTDMQRHTDDTGWLLSSWLQVLGESIPDTETDDLHCICFWRLLQLEEILETVYLISLTILTTLGEVNQTVGILVIEILCIAIPLGLLSGILLRKAVLLGKRKIAKWRSETPKEQPDYLAMIN
ncbi:hypothetical protein PROFUN_00235 [Planoprotostelium fungivorum]|uniref:Right handed beta helix domain-containing protein n=1 Tax=Planoprotostelium fungivorum TaxID=1890364 RepID=A0A2P6NXS9_9EUKA|nr:hypothetical protein PROFUN_00235 [Planoprotostelium fungivorum]